MKKRFPANEFERIKYLIDMHKVLFPHIPLVDSKTKINGTELGKLCSDKNSGVKGPYQRVRDWFESQVLDKESAFELKFSGKKDTYETGATRDSSEGKGRYDLINPLFLKRLAKVLEAGAKNHGPNNWKKGIYYSRLIDSALRHISQFNEGLKDEDHLAQAVANLMFLIYFEEEKQQDLNDLNHQQKLI